MDVSRGDQDKEQGLRVLVVDDDISILAMLRIALTLEDRVQEVREACDGVQAVQQCSDFAPDVVFMDYWMPNMDGATAAGRVRTMHPDARIIAFSGVLEDKPEWADQVIIKGDMPDIEIVLDEACHTA